MAGLKSFLYGAAPILGVTGAVLYERQRALVSLGVLKAAKGRGPGSGVPLTAENVAAVIISLLAAGSLSEVDERVVALCKTRPENARWTGSKSQAHWERVGKPTFHSEVARILSGQPMRFHDTKHILGIRVSRCWRGQIMHGRGSLIPIEFFIDGPDRYEWSQRISVTAEIEEEMLAKLVIYTQGALSQAAGLEEEDDE